MSPPLSEHSPSVVTKAAATAIERARAVRKQKTEELSRRIEELAKEHLPPRPSDLVSPAFGEQARVRWTPAEWDALYFGVKELVAKMDGFANLSEFMRIVAFGLISQEVQAVYFPEHRQRVPNIGTMPEEQRRRFSSLLGLEAVDTKAAPVTHKPVVEWSKEEASAFLVHLAHLMRKQNLWHIPDGDDREGCIMLADYARQAQCNALPRHRRFDMQNPRAEMEAMDLFARLGPLLKVPVLPPLPSKAPEIEELMESKAPEAVPQSPQLAPKPPKIASIDEFSDDEIAQAFVARFMSHSAHVSRLEKVLNEVQGMNALLVEEAASLRQKAEETEDRLRALEERHRQAPVAAATPRRSLPRVAIIGCRKDEFDRVVERAKQENLPVEFRLYEQDSRIQPVVAQYAITMKWRSRIWDDLVEKSGIPRSRRSYCDGSINRVHEQLVNWFGSSAKGASAA